MAKKPGLPDVIDDIFPHNMRYWIDQVRAMRASDGTGTWVLHDDHNLDWAEYVLPDGTKVKLTADIIRLMEARERAVMQSAVREATRYFVKDLIPYV